MGGMGEIGIDVMLRRRKAQRQDDRGRDKQDVDLQQGGRLVQRFE